VTHRTAFIDRSPGETRAGVLLDGRPERLFLIRDDDPPAARWGERLVVRVRRIEKGLGQAFVELPDGLEATASIAGLTEGAAFEAEVAAEARRGKAAVVRRLGAADGEVRRISAPLDLETRLRALAPDRALLQGAPARDAADLAQAGVLAVREAMPGGGWATIETTQALTAVDVDMGARGGGDARRAARQANQAAIAESARRLRLKGLGGLVVIDLVGKGHDGAALSTIAREAFAPDGPSVSIGPISRFGLFELSLPRTITPLAERLTDSDGRVSAATLALDLARAIERHAAADPGGRFTVRCHPDVADEMTRLEPLLLDRFGQRFSVASDPGLQRDAHGIDP